MYFAKFQFVERIDAILLVVFTSAYTPFGRTFATKTHFCLPTKVTFFNDVCLRQMMTASPNDAADANDVGFA